ncbi:hypothetical protein COT86_01375 [Candidatus Collierbacteria bacterium CG10_big_fil_rev_8_21_14_0_10_43_36]|uniref:Nucleoside diphosphate kinase-like domain-containing protein n=3 Tax=Candidatus Collieribacteriota TaxID=1752725 RepID=A0A2H0DTQ4_9BACT|nr:hypothetical protein [Candidatus Parcubacteria bacterium]PIP85565.1 MAG: hypothetical protein COW83_03630 [Candidatus Collierbacteria bacterium CG22_combo_CG10-13_8_21_14_all_43_12]PIR99923.1 MAG: hypothetical protein COT86_01375 [Candidatus Collierbacteria bacterium CG10_big_fil_rev_8_21_14_0_10_43_36]PIZ24729.1 MAG: hypothetical protein COY48_01365 [Candidatus Collierbacteria bacterium CG_4_10_14_0_8_um_filter_43_86]PJB47045.1 MAG: hypothetical protein CO104_04840 [Candidatus Collierbacter
MINKEIEQIGQTQVEIEAVPDEIGFAILKPDAVSTDIAEAILGKIKEAGLEVLHKEEVFLNQEMIAQLYGDRILLEWADELFRYLSSGQSMILIVGGSCASESLMKIRNEVRKDHGCDFLHNLIHASDTPTEAMAEASLFFDIGNL